MPDIKEYSSAMSIDSATGKVMPKTEVARRSFKLTKLHSNVSIVASGNASNTDWQDASGFNEAAFTIVNADNTQFAANVIWSHDKVNVHGAESLLAPAVGVWGNSRAVQTTVKAQYFKLILLNSDSAAAHVFNSWSYLKA
jgi:hypothetical protein